MSSYNHKMVTLGILALLCVIAILPSAFASKNPEIQLIIADQQKQYVISVVNHKVFAHEGVASDPDGIVTMSSSTFFRIFKAQDKALAAYQAYRSGEIDADIKLSYAEAWMKGYFRIYASFKKQHPELRLG